MGTSAQVAGIGDTNSNSLEDIRVLATILLVAYHVIGTPHSGLDIANPHPLRVFADLLGDFRMPAFAFIAGFIYALRPPTLSSFGAFARGKMHRIAIPGLIAALSFNAIALFMMHPRAAPLDRLWEVVLFPYEHYWFLQAILVLFAAIGIADALTRNKAELILLGIAIPLSLMDLPFIPLFSISYAMDLAPLFLFGMCVYRHADWIERHARPVTLIALAAIALWFAWTIFDYRQDGDIEVGDRQLEHIVFGASACLLMLLYLPHQPLAKLLGRLCFTVYLYHVFGTAGMRAALNAVGIESIPVHLLAGVGAGLLLPIAIHLAAMRSPLAARLILGIKRKPIVPPEPATIPDILAPVPSAKEKARALG